MRPCISSLLFITFAASSVAASMDDMMKADHPVVRWTSNPALTKPLLHGGAEIGEGPRPPEFPTFGETNHALVLHKPGASVRVPDKDGALTFKKNDSITLEAWVQCDEIGHGQNVYIVSKGRTGRAGLPAHNQNWGLRLREGDGTARVSFVFRDERDATAKGDEFWHRWTADSGFAPGAGWHYVAVSYKFGEPESVRGFLDGEEVKGGWDMGGATALGPWADDDEVWIGTSMGGAPASSFRGRIDDVAVYRAQLDSDKLKARFVRVAPALTADVGELPKNLVRVEILEHDVKEIEGKPGDWVVNDADPPKAAAGREASWTNVPTTVTESWTEPAFALADVVPKFSPRGVRRDRSAPFMIRMAGRVTLPAGEQKILVRAIRGGRLSIDGKVVATSAFFPKIAGPVRASDAEPVPDQFEIQLVKEMALLPPGHSEALATVKGDGRSHVVVFEAFVGGKNLRQEPGQPTVSISNNGAPFHLLASADRQIEVTDDAWKNYAVEQRAHVAELSAQRRANPAELAYWKMRHDLARAEIAKKPPIAIPQGRNSNSKVNNPIDTFVDAKMAAASITAAPLADDATFLRRVTLDAIGLLPTLEELAAFLRESAPDKRSRAIDRLVADVRWADQWLPYWQDVLAENPALLKATLNNTGPFRFFLHDALRDNWPMDRFATALVLMEGSTLNGGSAGFAMASQNDLPMANKAQIVSSAFLAMEMKCARCHDAPNHPYDQADLFSLSAMLQREPLKVPGSSLTQGLNPNSHVTVSLKPGQMIPAHFPFTDMKTEPLPGVLRNAEDSREVLVAIMTDPRNERFAQVAANRLWKRLLGWGIFDPVEDWDSGAPSHRDLLDWLGRELSTHDYDLKHLARLIMNSETYQRVVTDAGSHFAKSGQRFFQSPARRRLSAEQLVDSLFQIAGKEFDCEPLNFDLDGRRPAKDFMNLGVPRRAWEFVGMSNERDRPALAKPAASAVTDVLVNYGWRDSRAEPRSTREEAPNVLQPAILANGLLGSRITRLSDDSAFTAMALKQQPLDTLVTQLFARVLSRTPSDKERKTFTAALAEGYDDRLRAVGTGDLPKKARMTKAVMWSNHLNPDATTAVYESEKIVRAGDPPTPRLAAAWRERMEDAVWALMLTPEFTYVP